MAKIGRPRKAPVPCSVEGCEAVARCRGWCSKHARRFYQHGDVTVRHKAPPWTAAEDALLLSLPLMPRSRHVRPGYLADAADRLNRTWGACRKRLHDLRNARARAAAVTPW